MAADLTPSDQIRMVNLTIIKAIKETWWEGATVSETLGAAQADVEAQRDDADSTDTILRDAEYYLKARWLVSERKYLAEKLIYSVAGVAASEVYTWLKILLPDSVTRSNPNKPSSPPGGTVWVILGAIDGTMDDGQATSMPVAPRLAQLRAGPG